MKRYIFLTFIVLFTNVSFTQVDSIVIPESPILDLQFLIAEAMLNNPEIQAALYEWDMQEAKIPQAVALDDPELKYLREEMPDFRWSEAMYSRLEFMQMLRFPSKLSTQRLLAEIRAEHAHHDHLEKVNEVISKLKSAYYELWYVQQTIVLTQENIRLMSQFASVARTRYSVGFAQQQDILKAQVEVSVLRNELISLRQQELSAKAMLMSILNRAPNDTLGFAVIPEEIVFTANLDTLLQYAIQNRPMLIHDSLGITEGQTMLSLARQEYLPDIKLGLQRVTYSLIGGINGWSVSVGITLPFAPWTLGKASARIEEGKAAVEKARSQYQASRQMVVASIKDLYYKTSGLKQRLDIFAKQILPQAKQSLDASLTAYQTNRADFLTLLDAYRTNVDLTKEYFMLRMQFEQTLTQLEREVGSQYAATLNSGKETNNE
jgi:cobalt-zinc-cadmium efflux system outer membrane protein